MVTANTIARSINNAYNVLSSLSMLILFFSVVVLVVVPTKITKASSSSSSIVFPSQRSRYHNNNINNSNNNNRDVTFFVTPSLRNSKHQYYYSSSSQQLRMVLRNGRSSGSNSSSSSSSSSTHYFTNNGNSCYYIPPYGMVPRTIATTAAATTAIIPSLTRMKMSNTNNNINDYYLYDDDYVDDDNTNNRNSYYYRRINSSSTSNQRRRRQRNMKDPVIQDFGSLQDWRTNKIGVGRLGDSKLGDDGVNEVVVVGGGGGYSTSRRRRDERNRRPPVFDNEMEGGNFWINPTESMDRYPDGPPFPSIMNSPGGDNESMMIPLPPPPPPRRMNRRSRNRNIYDDDNNDGEWWETKRQRERIDGIDGYYDDDDDDEDDDEDMMVDMFDEDYFDEEGEDEYFNRGTTSRRPRGNEYGVPPPTRSRSSFRTGAPPPPRPIKQFYDKLFWFGFDPDATRPTDRTMFGGTRGKFNAIDLLRDREERQRYYRDSGREYSGNNNWRRRRSPPGSRSGKDSVIQDFGSVQDWNARKTGRGRTGGDAVGDDVVNRRDLDPRFDNDYVLLDDEFDELGVGRVDERGRRSSVGGDRQRERRRGRRRRNSSSGSMDRRAEEYDRIIGLGAPSDDDDYLQRPPRRRSGFAYKYSDGDVDLLLDDGEYIDVEPMMYASERDLDMARAELASSPRESLLTQRRRRRLTWEERAMDMDRVPPRGAISWGPNGPVGNGSESPLETAAMNALRDINESKIFLEQKENDVEDAKNEVVYLKANASLCRNKLEDARGREASKLEEELGYILRDVDDASRTLRLARAERDAASNKVNDLEERNWAILNEYEAARSFEEDMN